MLADKARMAIIPQEGISGILALREHWNMPVSRAEPLSALTGHLALHNVPFVRITDDAEPAEMTLQY